MLERLAELEHIQWAHWTKYMLDNITADNIARWRRQIDTPYCDLSEKEKESDREWARKVMEITSGSKPATEIHHYYDGRPYSYDSFGDPLG